MARDVIEYREGGTRVRVQGLRDVLRKLNQAGADAEDQKALMHKLGNMVIDAAAPPVLSGQLAATMRAGRGKTKAVVRAGYAARAPYAGVIHYGWPARNIPANPFLTDALRSSQARLFQALENGIDELLRKNDLK